MYFFLFQVSAVFHIVRRRKNEMDEVIKVITIIKFWYRRTFPLKSKHFLFDTELSNPYLAEQIWISRAITEIVRTIYESVLYAA